MIPTKKLTAEQIDAINEFAATHDDYTDELPPITPEEIARMKPRYPDRFGKGGEDGMGIWLGGDVARVVSDTARKTHKTPAEVVGDLVRAAMSAAAVL